MERILHLSASPRGGRSKSLQVARAFFDEYEKQSPQDEILERDVFNMELPEFNGHVIRAKYNILHQRESNDAEQQAWHRVEAVIADFKQADKYVLSVPMWNFGIPYRLKHYFDVLVQPGYTFSYDSESGYTGLVSDKPVVVIYARGGEYSQGEAANRDLQKPYVETVLGFIGLVDVQSIVIEPTLAGGPEVAGERVRDAESRARELARSF